MRGKSSLLPLLWGLSLARACEQTGCSGHGVCYQGTCTCEADYTGADCAIRAPRYRSFTRPSTSSYARPTRLKASGSPPLSGWHSRALEW